jgi:hypothetical protein
LKHDGYRLQIHVRDGRVRPAASFVAEKHRGRNLSRSLSFDTTLLDQFSYKLPTTSLP